MSYATELAEVVKLSTLAQEPWGTEVRFLDQFIYKYKNQHRRADFFRALQIAARKLRHAEIFRLTLLSSYSADPESLELILEHVIDGMRFAMVSIAHCIPTFLRQIGRSYAICKILLLKSLLLLERVHSAVEKRAQAAAAETHVQLKATSKLRHKPAVESLPTIYDLVMRLLRANLELSWILSSSTTDSISKSSTISSSLRCYSASASSSMLPSGPPTSPSLISPAISATTLSLIGELTVRHPTSSFLPQSISPALMAVAVSETTSGVSTGTSSSSHDFGTTMDTAGAFGLPIWSAIPNSLAASLRSILNWNIVDLNQQKLTQALSLSQLRPFFPSSLPSTFSEGLASGAEILFSVSGTSKVPSTVNTTGSLNSQRGKTSNSSQYLPHNSSQLSKKSQVVTSTVAAASNPVLMSQNGLLIAQSSSDEESDVKTSTTTKIRKNGRDVVNSTGGDSDINETTNDNGVSNLKSSKAQTKKSGASFFATSASSSASRSGSVPVVSTPTAAELEQKKRKAGGNLEDLFAGILPAKKPKLVTGASSSPTKSITNTKSDSLISSVAPVTSTNTKSKNTQFSLDDMFSKAITSKAISTLSSSAKEGGKSAGPISSPKSVTENAKLTKTSQEKVASEARKAAMAILGAPSGLKKKKKV